MAGGRPIGATNKDKPFRAALVRTAANHPDRLDKLAEMLWTRAIDGKDIQAAREIADRFDGKPAQETNITVTRTKASEISDDALADIAAGSSEGAAEAPSDPSRLN